MSGSEWEGMEVTPFSTPNKSLFLVGVNACALRRAQALRPYKSIHLDRASFWECIPMKVALTLNPSPILGEGL